MDKMEVLADDKNGTIMDITDIVSSITVTTKRLGRPGEASLRVLPFFDFEPGYILRIKAGEWGVFYGYVFEVSRDQDVINITAYDQTRYLLSKDTYVFSAKKASDIAKTIATDNGLRIGTISDTGYVIPSLIEDNQVLLDIIQSSIVETTHATGRLYVFGDVFGFIELWDPSARIYGLAITADTLISKYTYKRSI
ncbi:MAG: hypothetical protein RBR24_06890, partial [Candidatus Carbobacillus sp.]|nr:hypothetical protein [Candidatus Carbobacillus sp.]